MSFWSVVSDITKNLIKTFEKNADKAVDDPDDGSQADQDAKKAGQDTSNTARDGANDEIRNHDPAWKSVKDLSDKVIAAEPKVVAAAKYGWLKFLGAVTAIFAGTMVFVATQTPSKSPDQQAAEDVLRHARETQQQVEYLDKIVVSEDEFNTMIGGIAVPSAPTPTELPAATPAQAAVLPPPVAAVAAEPARVEVATSSGTQTYTTTVGQVYREAPERVRREMDSSDPPPSKIEHDYDHENPNDCFHTHCLGGDINTAGGFHKDFTVDAGFASAHITY